MKSSWRNALCGLLVLTPVVALGINTATVTTVATNFPANGGIAIDAKGDFYVSDFKGTGTPQNPLGTTFWPSTLRLTRTRASSSDVHELTHA